MKMKKLTAALFAALLSSSLVLNVITPLNANAGEMLGQTNFDDGVGLPWHTCETAPADCDFDITGGKYQVTINNPGGASRGGEDRWDIQLRHRGLKIVSGRQYHVKYEITATNSGMFYTKIGNLDGDVEIWHNMCTSQGDFGSTWDCMPISANQTKAVDLTFTASQSLDVAEWAFHLGGSGKYTPTDCFPAGTVVSFDNMSLECIGNTDTDYKKAEPWVRPEILVNQLGYYTDSEKKATLVSDSSDSIAFDVLDSSGKSVYSGKSTAFGQDKDSGDTVHILNFSDFKDEGKDYTLSAGKAVSHPFNIGKDIYYEMLYDSLKYFYHNRSGEVAMPYCDDDQFARAAGPADTAVKTETGQKFASWAYNDSYTLDVSGGWYDAGDHGKYVVNGGLTVWTLQNIYERTLYAEGATSSLYGDSSMNIPESSNGYADILDEARYELEFMLKMMVPDGKTLAGMVHHKIHDTSWTGLGIAPADDKKDRIIKPPTTAATLNLAAAAAQGYRLWKDTDSAFADKCLAAAEKAYAAAVAHPSIYAPLDETVGGGAYGDDNVTDEFYWAACELYISTGKEEYYSAMKSSDYNLKVNTSLNGGEDKDTPSSFNWGNTAALGSLSLSIAPNKLSEDELNTVKSNITSASDYYLKLESEQGYGIPFKQCTVAEKITGYPWGSNSFVMNNAIVMAYAYDITKDSKYINGVAEAMDYLMGRNPVDYCYVTGYGDHSTANPHHRFFAKQIDEKFPSAPSGFISGGPNSGLQDPWVKGLGWKVGEKAPQLCYMDHIESWATNEVAINWNAPLAWLTGYMTDTLSDAEGPAPKNTAKTDNSSKADKDDTSKSENSSIDKSSDNKVSESKETGVSKLLIIVLVAIALLLAAVLTVGIIILKKMNKQKKAESAGKETTNYQANGGYVQNNDWENTDGNGSSQNNDQNGNN